MKKNQPVIILLLLLSGIFLVSGQDTQKARFQGNSYTTVNKLPRWIANPGSSGQALIFSSNTPNDYTCRHLTHALSPEKVARALGSCRTTGPKQGFGLPGPV